MWRNETNVNKQNEEKKRRTCEFDDEEGQIDTMLTGYCITK